MRGEEIVSEEQIDRLCLDWLQENYGEEVACEYRSDSLVIPSLNRPDLNEALADMKRVLSIAFGPDESFGSLDYHRARKELGLADDSASAPDVFADAFATVWEESRYWPPNGP